MGVRFDGPSDDLGEVHEINVTPFIDVILVLLIIFMVAAPLSTVDVPVELPAVAATSQPRPEKPIFLTVKLDRSLVLGEQPVSAEGLATALAQAANGDKQSRIFLRADKAVAYGEVIAIMERMRLAGFTKVALVALEAAGHP